MRKWDKVPRHPNVYTYQTTRGKKYGIRRTYNDSLGKRQEYTKSGFNSWRDAEIILKQFEAKLSLNDIDVISARSITFGEYWETLRNHKISSNKWRINTVAQKDSYYKTGLKYILDRF